MSLRKHWTPEFREEFIGAVRAVVRKECQRHKVKGRVVFSYQNTRVLRKIRKRVAVKVYWQFREDERVHICDIAAAMSRHPDSVTEMLFGRGGSKANPQPGSACQGVAGSGCSNQG